MLVEPVVLEGRRVRLEPMSMDHLDALADAGGYDELWLLTRNDAATRDGMKAYMKAALEEQGRGTALPFVTIDKSTGAIVGSTRFGNIEPGDRRVEIGWTWITPAFQRSYVNSEAKYLMLSHAFEVWKCARVELKTDALNSTSREAIRRIGGTEEGILRRHMITHTGRYRDTVYYSILDTEWPAVCEKLASFIAR